MSFHERHLCEACLKKEYEEFRHACVHESIDKNDVWRKQYKIGDWPRWDYSDTTETLTFSKDGEPRVVCDIQFVGSTQGDSWQWCWGNKNYSVEKRQRMDAVRALGEDKGWDQLTSLFLDNNDEYLGWECTSVANHVLGGIGSYRWPANKEENTRDFFYVVILAARFVN